MIHSTSKSPPNNHDVLVFLELLTNKFGGKGYLPVTSPRPVEVGFVHWVQHHLELPDPIISLP